MTQIQTLYTDNIFKNIQKILVSYLEYGEF